MNLRATWIVRGLSSFVRTIVAFSERQPYAIAPYCAIFDESSRARDRLKTTVRFDAVHGGKEVTDRLSPRRLNTRISDPIR